MTERVSTAPPLGLSLLLASIVAAAHLLFARLSVAVPYVFGDEAGYLTKAAALAGVPTDAYSSYYPGYALLLAPLYALSPDTLTIYAAVQGLNALLSGLAAWLLLALSGELAPTQPVGRRWLAVLVIAGYPAFLAYSAFALSENLFVPLVLLLALLLVRQVRESRRRNVFALAGASALLVLVHPKGAVVVAALHLGWTAGTWRRGTERRLALLSLALAVGTFVLLHGLGERFFRHRMGFYSDGISGHYPGVGEMLRELASLLTMHRVATLTLDSLGQLFYLGVASFGWTLLGVAALAADACKPVSRPERDVPVERAEVRRAYAVFALLALLGTVAMTAFFLRGGDRIDHRFFGRYDEGVVALAMLAAWLRPFGARAWCLAAVSIAAMGAVLLLRLGMRLDGPFVPLNVSGLQFWRLLGEQVIGTESLHLGAIVGGGSLLVAAMSLVARRMLPTLATGCFFVFGSVLASLGYLRPESDINAARHRVADYLHAHYPAIACVDYDIRASEYWQRYNDQVTLLPIRMHESAVTPLQPGDAEHGRTQARCSDLVISATPRLDRFYPGARLLQRENGSKESLWWVPRDRSGRR